MNPADKPLIGVLLAGGQSSRMGQDKTTLTIAGTSLLEFMRAKLLRAGLEEIVICRNAAGYLNDAIAELGPLGALYTLSRQYPERRALIIPVDMPLLRVASLKAFTAATAGSTLPACPGQQMFPLYLAFTPAVNAALTRRVNKADDLSIAAFLRETDGRQLSNVEIHDDEFLNANTPQQWQRILAKVNTPLSE